MGGGRICEAYNTAATVAGGWLNKAGGRYSAVLGGAENVVGGDYSAILGGWGDTISASGNYSYLFGIQSRLDADSTFMVDMPHIRFGDEASGYEFPTSDGSAGQALTTNGGGQLNWTSISGGSGGGWTDDGAVVRLDTGADEVGVGTVSPDAKLHVEAAQMHAARFTSSVGTSDSAVVTADYVGGGDVDAVAVHGRSRPNDYWGIGGRFEGNYLGMEAIAYPSDADPSYAYAGAVTTARGGNAKNYGLKAFAGDCVQATAIYANATNSTEFTIGVHGAANVDTSNSAIGVSDSAVTASTNNYGVYGFGVGELSTLNYGVYGEARQCANANVGVGGLASGNDGWKRGVHGIAEGSGNNYGVYGEATYGLGNYNYGVYGEASGGIVNWAGKFVGNVDVTGTLSKAAGSFKIDHPLDPGGKYLQHSFVESPDMMNVYNGNVTTDASGRAIVTLPDYFDALNKDYRYQLTVIGTFAQAIIEQEIRGNQFTIATDQPNVKVSWQVTGVRNDPYAKANRILTEVDKPAHEQDKFQHPGLYGFGTERAIHQSVEVFKNEQIEQIIRRDETSKKRPLETVK